MYYQVRELVLTRIIGHLSGITRLVFFLWYLFLLFTSYFFSLLDHLSFQDHLPRPSYQPILAHEVVAFQILVLLLEWPTDDSIEIPVGFTCEVGAFLSENSPIANATVFEWFRAVLKKEEISQRVQYMIEVLMQVRKDKQDKTISRWGVGSVKEDEQITHWIQLTKN